MASSQQSTIDALNRNITYYENKMKGHVTAADMSSIMSGIAADQATIASLRVSYSHEPETVSQLNDLDRRLSHIKPTVATKNGVRSLFPWGSAIADGIHAITNSKPAQVFWGRVQAEDKRIKDIQEGNINPYSALTNGIDNAFGLGKKK